MNMSETISSVLQMMEENSDPRTMKWFLAQSPVPLALITALYFGVVYFGPRIMAPRPAFQLKKVLVVYNFAVVLLSAWMVKEFAITSIFNPRFHLLCQLVDRSEEPMAVRLANVIWWFYFSKIVELLDTVFFILRKKNNQVSFLHVYHHSTMPSACYIQVRYLSGGTTYFCAMLNSFLHMLTYSYYLLSAFGPRLQPYLWWKRYITTLQLVQFLLMILHTGYGCYSCGGVRNVFTVGLGLYCMSHFILYSNFFYHSYIAKKGKNKASKVN